MSGMLVTVEQAAEELKLHPKTVLRYIHEGRLPATRIGKAYRIDREKLNAFAGIAAGAIPAKREVRTTAIVEIAAMDADAAAQLAAFLNAASLGAGANTPRLHASTAFDPVTRDMKIVAVGVPGDVARLLELIDLQLGLAG